MMRKNKILLNGLLFCCLSTGVQAQWGAFQFQRELGKVETGWQQLEIPDAMYRYLRPDLHDLRIKGINSQGDTLEAPYLIQWPVTIPAARPQKFRIINRSTRANAFFATLVNDDRMPINQIELDLENRNFDWRIRLEGSQDQQDWFTVLEDYRILAFSRPEESYSFSTLRFSESSYRYYRIRIPAVDKAKVRLKEARFHRELPSDLTYHASAISRQDIRVNRAEQRTEIELELPGPVPVSRVQLNVRDSFDYYRPLRIELRTDSTRTGSGWRYRYTTVFRGTLSSLETNVFTFPVKPTDHLRVFIENHDNTPLEIEQVQVSGIRPLVIARFTSSTKYLLFYGWPDAPPPRYDLHRFADKIPDPLPVLRPGPAQRLSPETSSNPLITNRAWLWLVMVVVIGLLGWFSLKMLKPKEV